MTEARTNDKKRNQHKPWEKNGNAQRKGKKYNTNRTGCVHTEDTLKKMRNGKLFCPVCWSEFKVKP